MPLVEETGLIHSIGEWVLQSAADRAQGWHALHGPAFAIGQHLAETVSTARCSAGCGRARCERGGLDEDARLELVEGALQRNQDEARAVLGGLRNLGVRVVLDDFGTGYSSMSQLRRFAIDGIKIDRSFVRGMTTNPDDRIVVKAMIDMARSLRINTIAGASRRRPSSTCCATWAAKYSGHLLAEPEHAERVRAAVAAAGERARAAAAALTAPAAVRGHFDRYLMARSSPSMVVGYIRPPKISRMTAIDWQYGHNCSGSGFSHTAFG